MVRRFPPVLNLGKKLRKLLDIYSVTLRFHLSRKLVFFGLIVYLLRTFGKVKLSINHWLAFLAFFLAYSSIYFVNDLLDLEFDAKRKHYTYPKPLALGLAKPKDFINIAYLHGILGTAASFLYSPAFGSLVLVTLLLAHVRHFIKNLSLRTFLLYLLEFLNFAALTYPFGLNHLFQLKFLVPLLLVCTYYAFLYFAYRRFEKAKFYTNLGTVLTLIFLAFYTAYFKVNSFRMFVLGVFVTLYAQIWRFSVEKIHHDWLMSLAQFAGAFILLSF